MAYKWDLFRGGIEPERARELAKHLPYQLSIEQWRQVYDRDIHSVLRAAPTLWTEDSSAVHLWLPAMFVDQILQMDCPPVADSATDYFGNPPCPCPVPLPTYRFSSLKSRRIFRRCGRSPQSIGLRPSSYNSPVHSPN